MQMRDDEKWEGVQVYADYIDPQPKWSAEVICELEEPARVAALPIFKHTLALAFLDGDATGAPLMLISTSEAGLEAATEAVDADSGDGAAAAGRVVWPAGT